MESSARQPVSDTFLPAQTRSDQHGLRRVREEKAASGAVDDGWTLFMTFTTRPGAACRTCTRTSMPSSQAGAPKAVNENELMLVVEPIPNHDRSRYQGHSR
jgi:hypothetical protein